MARVEGWGTAKEREGQRAKVHVGFGDRHSSDDTVMRVGQWAGVRKHSISNVSVDSVPTAVALDSLAVILLGVES